MKRAFCIAAAMTVTATSAWAGPNAGGVLFLHTNDEAYTSDVEDYAGTSGIDCDDNNDNDPDCPNPVDCSGMCGLLNPTSAVALGVEPLVIYVIAGFDNCPRLSGLTFGVNYDDSNIFIAAQGTGADLEIPTTNWPAPLSGTAITWNFAQTTQMTEVYWFAAYAYYEAGSFGLTGNPTQGFFFADDAIPANTDPVADSGVLGFGGAPGWLPYSLCLTPAPTLEKSWGEIKTTFSDNE